MSANEIQEANQKIRIFKKLRREFEVNSEKIIYMSNDIEEIALTDFVKAKNEFESNADQMIEIIDNEMHELDQFQDIFSKLEKNAKQEGKNGRIVISSKDVPTHADVVSMNEETLGLENEKGVESDDIRQFMFDKEYAEEYRRIRHSIVNISETKDEVAQLRNSFVGENHLMSMILLPRRQSMVSSVRVHPFIDKLLNNNEVFKLYPVIDTAEMRMCLPATRDPKVKINVWGILKENIGKDLSRITMPVYVKEPNTLLQKMAEFVENVHLLREANSSPDIHIRLAKVAGFFVIGFAQNRLRIKASFNSLLGETFEIIKDDLKFVVEAVSTHPPIQAFYCESDDFVLSGSFLLKTNLSIASMSFETLGDFDIHLKIPKENYKIVRPKIALHNYVLGDMYIWLKDDLVVTNINSNDSATVIFKPKGWSSKHDYEMTGGVYTSKNEKVYEVTGKWDSQMTIVNCETKQETLIVSKSPDMPNFEQQYYFSLFGVNLNYLPVGLTYLLAPTDSRLRPDTRAYENGNLDLASFEKNRLEENQRKRRKLKGEQTPLWFSFKMKGKTFESKYLGEYFKARESQQWPANIPNLFNE